MIMSYREIILLLPVPLSVSPSIMGVCRFFFLYNSLPSTSPQSLRRQAEQFCKQTIRDYPVWLWYKQLSWHTNYRCQSLEPLISYPHVSQVEVSTSLSSLRKWCLLFLGHENSSKSNSSRILYFQQSIVSIIRIWQKLTGICFRLELYSR